MILLAFGFGLGVLATVLAGAADMRRALKRPGVRTLTIAPLYGSSTFEAPK